MTIPEIIELDNNMQLINHSTTDAATTKDESINMINNNQKQQVTNMDIDNVSGNLLEYWHLIKCHNAKIWYKALANDLGQLAQGFGSIIPKETPFFHTLTQHHTGTEINVPKTRIITTTVKNQD